MEPILLELRLITTPILAAEQRLSVATLTESMLHQPMAVVEQHTTGVECQLEALNLELGPITIQFPVPL